MAPASTRNPLAERLRGARFKGAALLGIVAVLAFLVAGLIYNTVAILRLPQSGLKSLEIVWVSLTACVLVILLAMAVAAGLEHLGEALAPKSPGEEWMREQVRRHRLPGMEVALPGGTKPGRKTSGGSSSAA